MRHRSRKTAHTYRTQRVALVSALLEARPICQRCHAARSTDIHEMKTRARGGSILDESNLAALCHTCHAWITEHPAAAHEEGWLKHSWD